MEGTNRRHEVGMLAFDNLTAVGAAPDKVEQPPDLANEEAIGTDHFQYPIANKAFVIRRMSRPAG